MDAFYTEEPFVGTARRFNDRAFKPARVNFPGEVHTLIVNPSVDIGKVHRRSVGRLKELCTILERLLTEWTKNYKKRGQMDSDNRNDFILNGDMGDRLTSDQLINCYIFLTTRNFVIATVYRGTLHTHALIHGRVGTTRISCIFSHVPPTFRNIP